MSTYSVGQLIKGVKQIQAMDMANKAQLADTIAYFKKSQRYDTGNIMGSVTAALTPDVCAVMNPPLDKTDFAKGNAVLPQINQYLYKKVLAKFKKTSYYRGAQDDPNKLEKSLKLWWAWAGRDVLEEIHDNAVSEAQGNTYKQTVKDAYTNLSGKKQLERYQALFNAIK